MRSICLFITLLTLIASLEANLVGKVAPNISVSEGAINSDGVTNLESLRGQVVLIEFFSTR